MTEHARVTVVGGGLAGCEAAWQLARRGVRVRLLEMRPLRRTEAHQTDRLAELVCSNSFRSDDWTSNAVGLLHEEMRRAGSLVMAAADAHKVPAGAALAVDRHGFAAAVEAALRACSAIEIERRELTGLPTAADGPTIIATGPLTAAPLAEAIRAHTGVDSLAFFDAIAPIVHRESIDMQVAWFQSRYDKSGPGGGGADYINCPLDRQQYEDFVTALLAGDRVDFKDWEENTPYFEGCLPIEVMAGRGRDTLRFGPMKPVGLVDPRTGRRPWAVVQLRQDNALGSLFNIVGFQTKLRHGAQVEVFRRIPGLQAAEFARLGGLHRNTFIRSPALLDPILRLRTAPWIRFAGQVTGVEGYVESAAIGLLAGRFAAEDVRGVGPVPPPATTAFGALLGHITGGAAVATFQPMNVNFGLFPPPPPETDARRGRSGRADRKRAVADRALADLAGWLDAVPPVDGAMPHVLAAE